ncbi:MAG: glycosyltransferase family 10 [Hyphomonadaceae bacterium]
MKTLDAADFLVTRWMRNLTPEVMACGKPAIVWTHEPWFTVEPPPVVRRLHGFNDALVFSAHNRNVYTDNYYYAPDDSSLVPRSSGEVALIEDNDAERRRYETRRVVFFGRRGRDKPLVCRGVDVSLYVKRSDLALALRERGICDIYGKEWPDGVSRGESRFARQLGAVEPRAAAKLAVLADYPFSIAAENALIDYYVTEKLWEAIEGRTLPLYWPNQALAGVLPEGAVIDLTGDPSPDTVVGGLHDMRFEEWRDRLNLLIDFYQRAQRGHWIARSRLRTEANIRAAISCF